MSSMINHYLLTHILSFHLLHTIPAFPHPYHIFDAQQHQPGKIVDGIRTSTLEVLPPGSAPKESTFTPNPDNTEPVSVADAESEATGGKDVGRSGRREGKDV
jgi:hypothetical protein